MGGICTRHEIEKNNFVMYNWHLKMQKLKFVHVQKKPKRIKNMNLVIHNLNFQISNLLPKNALKLTDKHSRLENAFCNLTFRKQHLKSYFYTLQMLFMQIGEMRERLCQFGIVLLKILIFTPEIIHKIVVTFKILKIHCLHFLVQIFLQQMQLHKFKNNFHTLHQIYKPHLKD